VSAFDRLSPLLKTTIALTMMQGLSYPEAAVVLDTTEGTIAWRIHEARKQLRSALARTLQAPAREAVKPAQRAPKRAAPEAAPEPAGELNSLAMALALLAPGV